MAGGRTAARQPATRRCPASPGPSATALHLGPQSHNVTLVRLGETPDLRRAVEVHYITQIDDLLELALRPPPAATTPDGRVS